MSQVNVQRQVTVKTLPEEKQPVYERRIEIEGGRLPSPYREKERSHEKSAERESAEAWEIIL